MTSHHQFDRPVPIFIGLGSPREIVSVPDAYDLLLEWNGIPDLDFHAAVDVCRKALVGERTAEQAREAFERFANNRGILSKEALEQAAGNLAQKWRGVSA